MTYLVQRLAQLRRHLDHLHELQARGLSVEDLERDIDSHNSLLFSLLQVAQQTVDLAGELNSRRGVSFADYTEAIRNLGSDPRFPRSLVERLVPLAGFRNVLMHEYVAFELDRALAALNDLEPLDRFVRVVAEVAEAEEV